MKMHGLHGHQLEYFKNKPINEIIVILEEMIRNEMLSAKLESLTQVNSTANKAKLACSSVGGIMFKHAV